MLLHVGKEEVNRNHPIRWLFVVLLTALTLAERGHWQQAEAELLPETGTFEGIYHKQPWGNAAFEFFVVPPELQKKLDPFDGKPIRLTVTKGIQRMNPGPSEMQELGRIEELTPAPIELRVVTVPETPMANRPFQVVVGLKNVSKTPTLLEPIIGIATLCFSNWQHRAQMGWAFQDGASSASVRSGPLLLPPGGSFIWSVPVESLAGVGEIQVEFSLRWVDPESEFWVAGGLKELPGLKFHKAWRPLRVLSEKEAPPFARDETVTPLAAKDVRIAAGEDGWQDLEFRLAPAAGEKIQVLSAVDRLTGKVYRFATQGRLEGYSERGESVLAKIQRPGSDTDAGPAGRPVTILADLPAEGAPIRLRFQTNPDIPGPLVRLKFSTVTEHGVQDLFIPVPAPQ